MRTRKATLFLSILVPVALALTGVLHIVHSARADAEEAEKTKLLVKCATDQVSAVRRALAGLDVDVYDLGTMRLLPRPAAVPALRDAQHVMREIYAALAGIKPENGVVAMRVTAMAIRDRGATMTVEVATQAEFDLIVQALEANTVLNAGKARIERGAVQSLPDGRYRHTASLRFAEGTALGRQNRASARIDPLQLAEEAASRAQVQLMNASRLVDDPHRGDGYRTIYRDFTFAGASLAQFQTLLEHLAKSEEFTVWELRWELVPQKDQRDSGDLIGQSVVRLASRTLLTE